MKPVALMKAFFLLEQFEESTATDSSVEKLGTLHTFVVLVLPPFFFLRLSFVAEINLFAPDIVYLTLL
jgi:hypothetical protein